MSERTRMFELTRRELIAGGMTLGAASLLAACVGTTPGGGGGGGGGASTGVVTLQNSIQDADPKAALEALVKAYPGGDVTMNSVATEQFRAQLTNYLRSGHAPEVLSWYAGSVARSYAEEGLLLDVSPLWEGDGACAASGSGTTREFRTPSGPPSCRATRSSTRTKASRASTSRRSRPAVSPCAVG